MFERDPRTRELISFFEGLDDVVLVAGLRAAVAFEPPAVEDCEGLAADDHGDDDDGLVSARSIARVLCILITRQFNAVMHEQRGCRL